MSFGARGVAPLPRDSEARAAEAAKLVVFLVGEDIRVAAIHSIDEVLMLAGLWSAQSIQILQHIRDCLGTLEGLAVNATRGFDAVLRSDFRFLCTSAGMEWLYSSCMVAIGEAIAISMIYDGTFQQVMGLDIERNTWSRLAHARILMKRYIKGLGQNLQHIGNNA
jgi:hypothetical protein